MALLGRYAEAQQELDSISCTDPIPQIGGATRAPRRQLGTRRQVESRRAWETSSGA